MLHRNIGEKTFDTNVFDICENSGALSWATPDEIDFIPGSYEDFTGVTIIVIAEGVKVADYG